ncbi:unnamed protein product [Gadus morhua 'NCC']
MYQRTGKKDTPSVEKTARTAPFDPRQRSTQRRKPGRRGGIRRRLRQRKFRPALPSMILANLRSIQNRIEEIRRYARFAVSGTEERYTDILKSVIVHPDDSVQISGVQVAQAFGHLNARKSTGPDNITASVLKTYSEEFAHVWQPIFQSLDPHCPHCLENLTCDPASKENMPKAMQ